MMKTNFIVLRIFIMMAEWTMLHCNNFVCLQVCNLKQGNLEIFKYVHQFGGIR